MKKLVIPLTVLILIPILFFSMLSTPILAKRALPALNAIKKSTKTVSATKGVNIKVKFRGDRRAIVTTFSNLSIASKVDYSLSYVTRGTTQGASGSISIAEDPVARELIFGTCSHGVCRYDSGITNAKFTVITTLKNGKRISKSFKLKI